MLFPSVLKASDRSNNDLSIQIKEIQLNSLIKTSLKAAGSPVNFQDLNKTILNTKIAGLTLISTLFH